ncbi:hypothetical protein [Microcystis aeruginosa]|nr:hypothetical protein [Microcystis aeruginosa]MDB9390561.1 hypothetical protein [Microcystis aeruginosa CS-579]
MQKELEGISHKVLTQQLREVRVRWTDSPKSLSRNSCQS